MAQRAARSLALAGFLFLFCLPGSSQEFRATISGRMVDPSGMVIPQADVTVVNTATQVRTATRTTTDGNFVLPQLPPGTYDLTAEAKGFRSYRRQGMTLAVGDRATVEINMEVGELSSS